VRRLLRTVAVSAAIAALVTGTTGCLGGARSPGDDAARPPVRDGIATGAYPYVMACQVFTAADVRAITGRPANPTNIQGKYSAGFPRTAPQDKAFASTCARDPQRPADISLPDVYEVSIRQYPDTALVKEMIKHPPKVHGSQIRAPRLAGRFGAGAILNRGVVAGSAILSFFYQNKAVDVDITLATGGNDAILRTQAVKLGKRVLRRLRTGAGTHAFVMGPASGRLAGHRYFPACKLLTAAGVTAAFRGQTVDLANIEFGYAEGLTHNTAAEEAIVEAGGGTRVIYNIVDGDCGYTIGTGNSQFEVKLSAGQIFDSTPASQDTLFSPFRLTTRGEKISGVGRAAKIAALKHGIIGHSDPELLIRYPLLLVRVGLVGFTGSKAQRTEYLEKIAHQLPARLP
jgi:hypothetical protein